MDHASTPFQQLSLACQRLDDDELLYAKSYLRGAESIATIRCKVGGSIASLLCAHSAGKALLGIIGTAHTDIGPLLTALRDCGLVASALVLLLTLIAGASLRRELHAAALPEEVKRHLRRVASGMGAQVFRRYVRRLLALGRG